jgi:DNA-binding CsgD family transcriptional regulator
MADKYRVYAEDMDGRRRFIASAIADNGGRGLFDLYADECGDEEEIVIVLEEIAQAASIMGRKGGSAKSEAKTRANRNKGQGRKPGSGGLTELQREALSLKQQGLSTKQIGERMGRNTENVRQILARAAKK